MEVRWLSDGDYAACLTEQFDSVSKVKEGHPGIILGTEHSPCITLGRRNKEWNPGPGCSLPAHPIQRGGLATYHGPGQATVYPIISIAAYQLGVRRWAGLIEEATIETLRQVGVKAHLRPKCPGVYASKGKIASIGFHILDGVSMHGVSVIVKHELSGFQHIDPCGVPNQLLSSIEHEKGDEIEVKAYGEMLMNEIKKRLQA